jgi:hypothetical protein
MEEPRRILEENGSALERALLQEGRSYSAPEAVRVHTLAAVGLVASAGLGGGLLAWWSAKSLATKLALALSTVAAVTVLPVTYLLSGKDAPAAHSEPATPTAPVAPAPIQAEAPVPPAPAPLPATPADSPSPAPAPARPAPSSSALRAELTALDAIRTALANDDPAGAMKFIAAYFRTFPHGRLHFEAEVLRIDALAKAGRSQAAKHHAQEFLRRHPNSVLTARVRPYAEN